MLAQAAVPVPFEESRGEVAVVGSSRCYYCLSEVNALLNQKVIEINGISLGRLFRDMT